jgi:hypothetical protein
MGTYGPPVDQLLKIDENLWERRTDWHDYVGMGIGPEHVPDLIRMAVDPDLYEVEQDDPVGWAPLHAWRALGVLRAEEAIPTLVGIIADQDPEDPNDWIVEELPNVFAMIGPAATFELTALVEREDASQDARDDACRALTEMAKQHPGEREGVVATLTRWLERAESFEPSSNGFVVSDLIDLEAKEAAEVIERAYAGGFVDDSICGTWYDVWHELELEGEPPPRPKNAYRDRIPNPSIDQFATGGDRPIIRSRVMTTPPPEGWKPVESRSPIDRKDRNKARQKLEKKVKGKGKGGKRR